MDNDRQSSFYSENPRALETRFGQYLKYVTPQGWQVAEEGRYALVLLAPDNEACTIVVGNSFTLNYDPSQYIHDMFVATQSQQLQLGQTRPAQPIAGFTTALEFDYTYMVSGIPCRGVAKCSIADSYDMRMMVITCAASYASQWANYASWLPQVASQVETINDAALGMYGYQQHNLNHSISESRQVEQYSEWSQTSLAGSPTRFSKVKSPEPSRSFRSNPPPSPVAAVPYSNFDDESEPIDFPPPSPVCPAPENYLVEPEPPSPAPPPSPSPTLSMEDRSQSSRSDSLTRYSNLDCPDVTPINIAFSIYAQLSIEPIEVGAKPITIQDTGTAELPQVEVVLRARGFDVEGSNTQIMEISRDDDSEVRFVLTPRQLGEQQIRVDFYQHGKPISTIKHNILVGGSPSNDRVSQPDRDPVLEFKVNSNISPPDLEICIELDRHNDRILYFELHSIKEKIDYNHAKFGQIILKDSPFEKMKAVYAELSAFAAIQPRKFISQDPISDRSIDRDSQQEAEQRIASVGNQLWDALIPDEFKQEYWKFKAKGVRSILITSDEPWVPWEMIKPYRFDRNIEVQDPFWCEQFAISRWLSGGGTADELPLKLVIPVAPNIVNLPAVATEIKFLEQLNMLNPDIQIVPQIDRSLDLQAYLKKQPDFSLLHFACHGGFNNILPDDSAIQLSGNDYLRPSDIHIYFAPPAARPIVFINACDGGRQGYSFTELGGWAQCLVKARVGAFVGAMWEVNDTLALEFAKNFYQALLQDNKTIGEAFQQARAVIHRQAPDNSTWLAYTLYADPEARLAQIAIN